MWTACQQCSKEHRQIVLTSHGPAHRQKSTGNEEGQGLHDALQVVLPKNSFFGLFCFSASNLCSLYMVFHLPCQTRPPWSDQPPIGWGIECQHFRLDLSWSLPLNSHTSLARIRKNSFTHAQTATNHSWHPLVCAVCVAGSQPPMISCIVSACGPSHGINLSPLQGDRKQSATQSAQFIEWTSQNRLRLCLVFGVNWAVFYSYFLGPKKKKSNPTISLSIMWGYTESFLYFCCLLIPFIQSGSCYPCQLQAPPPPPLLEYK